MTVWNGLRANQIAGGARSEFVEIVATCHAVRDVVRTIARSTAVTVSVSGPVEMS